MVMRYEFFCNGKLRENELNMLAVRHTDRQTRSSQRHFPAGGIHEVTVTLFCFISMPVDFCRHLVGKTVRNDCHCDGAEVRFVGKSVILWTCL